MYVPISEPPLKKRKTRKGTHSCWECKRRKERCIFDDGSDICVRCQSRNTACISQEFPDQQPSSPIVSTESQSASDLRHIKVLLQQLIIKLDTAHPDTASKRSKNNHGSVLGKTESDTSSVHLPKAEEITNDQREPRVWRNAATHLFLVDSILAEPQPFSLAKSQQEISRALYAALPSRSDAEVICRATTRHNLSDVLITVYDDTEFDCARLAQELLDYPPPTAPPVAIAKHLLRFATHLQQNFRVGVHEEIEELSAPLPTLIHSYADPAAQFVNQNEVQGSLDHLECITLHAMCQCMKGNTRMSWMVVRRAIAVAQMNDLHRRDGRRYGPATDGLKRLWIRINYWDRMSSLLLGLPMAVDDDNMAVKAVEEAESPLAKLERTHATILGGIIKRNHTELPLRSYNTTKALDQELQKAAEILPVFWWAMPFFPPDYSSTSDFQNAMRRLTVQMIHSWLILQCHLPYLLQTSACPGSELSRIACVDSARDVLNRYIVSKLLNQDNMVCRIADFLVFTAAVALALAYISGHHQCLLTSAWPTHRRRSDLALLQQVEEIVRAQQDFDSDTQGAYMADMLRQLLRAEAIAAGGDKIVVKHYKFADAGVEHEQEQSRQPGAVNIHVPYFGSITIVPGTSSTAAKTAQLGQANGVPEASIDDAAAPPIQFDSINTLWPDNFASVDDWALQGIDTTLFDNLLGQCLDGR